MYTVPSTLHTLLNVGYNKIGRRERFNIYCTQHATLLNTGNNKIERRERD